MRYEVKVNQKIVKTEIQKVQEQKNQPVQKDIVTDRMFDDSNIASMITNTDGLIVRTNKAFTNLIGNNKIISIKHNIIDFLHNSKEDLNSILESTNNYLEFRS